MEGLESWEITNFNLADRQIKIGKLGLVKIIKSDDGMVVLVGDSNYGVIDQEKPTAASFAKTESILGFVLDIGIRKEKMLTRGSGFYFGMPVISTQSARKVGQSDFDEQLFEKIGGLIDEKYKSRDVEKETEAMRLQLLFDTYNDARLLYPNFYAESYLSLLRIIEALSDTRLSHNIATFAATISPELNKEIYNKVIAIESYKQRIEIAVELFTSLLKKAKENNWKCKDQMEKIDDYGKFIFICFYSAYQYRNKFVHSGFPFPSTVMDSIGLNEGLGTAYLSPAMGISWQRNHRPEGLKDGDLIDIHQVILKDDEAKEFKEKYFQLLPTWYFLKCLVREALLNKVR